MSSFTRPAAMLPRYRLRANVLSKSFSISLLYERGIRFCMRCDTEVTDWAAVKQFAAGQCHVERAQRSGCAGLGMCIHRL